MPKSRNDLRFQALKLWQNAKGNPSRQDKIQSILNRYNDNISKTDTDKQASDLRERATADNKAYRERHGGQRSSVLDEIWQEANDKQMNTKYPRSVYMQGRVANQQSTTATMAKASGGKG